MMTRATRRAKGDLLRPAQRATGEDGSVLLLALLVTMLILGAGMLALWTTTASTRISSNLTRRQEALYAAESGIQRAQRLLGAVPNLSLLLEQGGGCTPLLDEPLGRGRVLCDGAIALENVRVIASTTAAAGQVRQSARNPTYTVFVRNDTAEYAWCNGQLDPGESDDDGDCDGSPGAETDLWRATNDQDGRVVVRSEGLAADGVSYVAVEVIVSQAPGELDIPDYSQEGGNPQGNNSHDVAMALPTP